MIPSASSWGFRGGGSVAIVISVHVAGLMQNVGGGACAIVEIRPCVACNAQITTVASPEFVHRDDNWATREPSGSAGDQGRGRSAITGRGYRTIVRLHPSAGSVVLSIKALLKEYLPVSDGRVLCETDL